MISAARMDHIWPSSMSSVFDAESTLGFEAALSVSGSGDKP